MVIVCRNAARGRAAQTEIIQASDNNAVVLLLAGLSSQKEVHKLATQFMAKFDQLYVLFDSTATINLSENSQLRSLRQFVPPIISAPVKRTR